MIKRINTGEIVHIISIFWLLGKFFIKSLLYIKNIIIYITMEVMRVSVTIRWSWKKIIWDIIGEALSIKDSIIQVAI